MRSPRPPAFTSLLPPLTIAAALITSTPASAQLAPDRAYFGVGRTIPMTVNVPADAAGEVEIALLAPPDAKQVERASAEAGKVDLAGLFPVLWSTTDPKTLYAQLLVGGRKIGPAVVLQPMLTPLHAQVVGQRVVFAPDEHRLYAGLRAWTDRHIVFDTSEGEIELALRPDQAPNTVWTIMRLVEDGFYTDIKIHRIVPRAGNGQPFVVQFGDPTGTGSGGAGFRFDLEPSALPHDFGVASIARGSAPDTNGSQIFICLSRAGTQQLDGLYAAFAETIRGADVLMRLERAPLADPQTGQPAEPAPTIRSARTVAAPPYGQGPPPVSRPLATDR